MGGVVDAVGGAINSFMGNDRSAPGAPNLGYDPAEVKRLKDERKAILNRMSGATPIRDGDGNITGYSGNTYESRALNRTLTGDETLKSQNQLLQRQLGMLPKTDSSGRPIIGTDPETGENITAPGYGDLMGRSEQMGTDLRNLGVGADSPVQSLVNEATGDQGYGGMMNALTGKGGITDRRAKYEKMFTGDNSFSSEAQALANKQNELMVGKDGTGGAAGDIASLRGELGGVDAEGNPTGLRAEIGQAQDAITGTTGTRSRIEGLESESKSARNALQDIGKKFGGLEQDIRNIGGEDLTGYYAGELEAQRASSEKGRAEKMRRAIAQGGGDLKDLARSEGQRADEVAQQKRADLLTASNQARTEGRAQTQSELEKIANISNLYSKQQGAEEARAGILDQMLSQYKASEGSTMQGAALTGQEAQMIQQQANMRQNEANMAMQGQNAQQQALQQRAQFAQTGAGMVGQDEATQMNAANLYGQGLNQRWQGINAQRQAMLDQNAMNNQQLGALNNQQTLMQQGQQGYMNQLAGQAQVQNLENAAGQYASMPLQYLQGDLDEQTQARLGQANMQYQSDMEEYNKPSGFDQAIETAGAVASVKVAFACIPEGAFIDVDKEFAVNIRDIQVGQNVIGYNGEKVKVIQKHEYLEDPTKERFLHIIFDDGAEIDLCDMHRVCNVRSGDLKVGDKLGGREVTEITKYADVRISYDLLTEDQGYQICGVPINSMIGEMAEATAQLMKAA